MDEMERILFRSCAIGFHGTDLLLFYSIDQISRHAAFHGAENDVFEFVDKL